MMMVTMSGTPERPKLPPAVVLLCDTFLSFWMMLVFWLVLDERDASVAYLPIPIGDRQVCWSSAPAGDGGGATICRLLQHRPTSALHK